ncbi:MAG: DUF3450 domain-containing protein [bacterium]|nr:DUF3450 domain-containing protein [bacterium]
MALQSIEDIIRALQEHPEWREPLLRALLPERYQQLPERVDNLEAALARLAAAQEATQQTLQRFIERTEQRFQQVEEQQRQQAARHDELVEKFIQLTERLDDLTVRLEQLTARVDQLAQQMAMMAARMERIEQDMGDVKGIALELFYRNHATALLGLRFRKLRVVDIGRLLDTLYEQRAPTREEAEQISRIDLLVKGVHRATGEEYLMVWEISWTVDEQDVSRALERAQLLRQWGLNTVPVVAGKGITGDARSTALSRGVLVLLDTVPLDGSGLV